MKKLFALLVLSFLTACRLTDATENQKNAYIFIDRLDGKDMSMCIIYEGHYYVTPMPDHYDQCPCQITKFYFEKLKNFPKDSNQSTE